MPQPLDLALVVLVAGLWPAWEHFVAFPRARRALAAGVPGARLSAYRGVLLWEWGLSLLVLLAWLRAGRPLAEIGLVAPTGVRLLVAVGLALVLVVLLLLQGRAIRRATPERQRRMAASVERRPVGLILPHTPAELPVYVAVAVTAGVCEEWLFRGFVLWVMSAWLGPWGALALSSLFFGLGHAYQGRNGVIGTGLVGLALGALFLWTRSLPVVMTLHALMDMQGVSIYPALARGAAGAEPDAAGAAETA